MPEENTPDVQRILKVRVPLIVVLAQKKMLLKEITEFSPGVVVQFEKSSDQPLELMANNRAIAEGEAVKVGENFGLRLTRVGPITEIIQQLGAGSEPV